MSKNYRLALAVALAFKLAGASAWSKQTPIEISPEWSKIVGIAKTNVSIQVCPEPPMRRDSRIHDPLFKALHNLDADYARLQPWFPYPKLAVAELRPPEKAKTFWDFTLMDQITEDFMQATAGRPVVFAIGTVPRWMFTTKTPTRYPENPNDIDWTYNSDRIVNESTVRLFADYQARVASWYINGGFGDEVGRWHSSGHHYKIDYWVVMNEPDSEENLSSLQYNQFYDAVVEAVRKVAPHIKFVGPALGGSGVTDRPDYMAYFLDPKNHRAGIPVDMVSYHFYSAPDSDETPEMMQHTIFDQADRFLTAARYMDEIRRRLSPTSLTDVEELGSTLSGAIAPQLIAPIPRSYWNLAGAMWAYVFGHLAVLGIDVVGAAELIDYPGQVAASTLMDWETGKPNSRYWVVKLLRDNFGPGDKVVQPLPAADESLGPNPAIQVYAQGFISREGRRKLLLVNKRGSSIDLTIFGAAGGVMQRVDESTDAAATKSPVPADTVRLPALAVAVITMPSK